MIETKDYRVVLTKHFIARVAIRAVFLRAEGALLDFLGRRRRDVPRMNSVDRFVFLIALGHYPIILFGIAFFFLEILILAVAPVVVFFILVVECRRTAWRGRA